MSKVLKFKSFWFNLGRIWTGKNGFANFFVFGKIFDRKVRKWHGVSVVNDHADTHVFMQNFANIFAKTKNFAKPKFCLWSFFYKKKCRKYRDTVSVRITGFCVFPFPILCLPKGEREIRHLLTSLLKRNPPYLGFSERYSMFSVKMDSTPLFCHDCVTVDKWQFFASKQCHSHLNFEHFISPQTENVYFPNTWINI